MTNYKSAGVDREGAEQWVKNIDQAIRSQYRPEVLSQIGEFGSVFELPKNYKNPVMVATTDGVGTKLLLAEMAGDSAFFSIGQDLVAMSVNDLLATGAEPLVFLDYLATGKLQASRNEYLLKGILEACRQSNCSLVGGETAEMPDFYPAGRMDVAGFCVGVMEREKRWKKDTIKEGDKIIGIPSSGFHSNGYSLVRRIMQSEGWNLDSEIEGEILGDFVLRPTTIYVNPVLDLLKNGKVKAGVHITGGGLVENLPRVFDSQKLQARLDAKSIASPFVMQAFCRAGKIESREAFSTWNMGVGFCLFCSPEAEEEILQNQNSWWSLGRVEQGTAGVLLEE